jgi:hypothetical protein
MSKQYYNPATSQYSFFHAGNPNLYIGSSPVIKSKSYLAKLREKQEELIRENAILPSRIQKSEEPTEKYYAQSEKSFLKSEISVDQKPNLINPEDEEILNIIRSERPKAEMRSSPKPCQEKYPSPKKKLITTEKCEEVESELKYQRAKYRKLEAQYNELLNKSSHSEVFYRNALENLKLELDNTTKENIIDPNIAFICKEILNIKNQLEKIK